MSIESIFQDLKGYMDLRKYDDCYYFVSPFFFKDTYDSVTFCLYKENDTLFISDCRYTFDYLRDKFLDFDKYGERLERIKKEFSITESERHEFIYEFPTDQAEAVMMQISFFIQGVTLLAYVDLD